MARLLRLLRDCRGLSAVEFAIMLPVTILMLGGLIDFGIAANQRTSLENGARAGAQVAMYRGLELEQIKASVIDATDLELVADDIDASEFYECDNAINVKVEADHQCTDGSGLGKYITVTASKSYEPIFTFLDFAIPTELKGSAVVRVP
ncbi:MAG: pilus assembly protein [Alphaproteobacteria bacterium]|nr:pilus assembly protein [Alphaproteobacteria bacterium]